MVHSARTLSQEHRVAGYCSVLHALELVGTTGEYGRRLRAAVIAIRLARPKVPRSPRKRQPPSGQ
jgi:hypothetical protein